MLRQVLRLKSSIASESPWILKVLCRTEWSSTGKLVARDRNQDAASSSQGWQKDAVLDVRNTLRASHGEDFLNRETKIWSQPDGRNEGLRGEPSYMEYSCLSRPERKMRAMRGRSCGVNIFVTMANRSELVNAFCHGDDFVTAAPQYQIEVFGKMLQEKFETRRIGMISAATHLDEELHRPIRVINDELMELEAEQKHVSRLLEDLGLIQGNLVKTPRVKLS